MRPIFKQEPPFSIEYELTEGCPLRCSMCGIKAIRGKENFYKFMSLETAEKLTKLISNAEWNPRIALVGRGEPSLNKDKVKIMKMIRKYLPTQHVTMITSGAGFVGNPNKTIMELFDAGITTITVDYYEDCDYVPKILAKLDIPIPVLRYPEDMKAGPSKRRTLKQRALIIVQDIRIATKGNHSQIHNYAGFGGAPNQSMQGKPCGKPFREMSMLYNGDFRICCMDWRGTYNMGNVYKINHINEIWHGRFLDHVRRKLYHGERTIPLCNGCDVRTYRVGLLPDKKGQLYLAGISDKDSVILKHLRTETVTKPVELKWE